MSGKNPADAAGTPGPSNDKPSHFIREIIEADVKAGKNGNGSSANSGMRESIRRDWTYQYVSVW